jgi:hypothetical protein
MRSVSISIVKNEADVIEAMVRHNLQYLDHMSIIDNGSVDGTLEILKELRDEGLPVDIRQNPEPGHQQDRYINAFLQSEDCDRSAYIFALDADEFISCGLADYRTFLATTPRSFLIRWKTYVPTEGSVSQEPNVLKRITHCRRREPSKGPVCKAVLSPLDTGKVRYRKGNHQLVGAETTEIPTIRLAHFPVRSTAQLACKVLLGSWNVTLRGRDRGEAAQWFAIADKIRHGGMPSTTDLTALAASYAAGRQIRIIREPLISPVPITLRYTHLAREPLVAALVEFTDSLVEQLRQKRPQDSATVNVVEGSSA